MQPEVELYHFAKARLQRQIAVLKTAGLMGVLPPIKHLSADEVGGSHRYMYGRCDLCDES